MTSPSDQLLAEQVRQGEQRLIGYERTQLTPGRFRRVQDVLQETLLHVWSGLRRDTPRDVRAWLLQVARNRCRDYFRSKAVCRDRGFGTYGQRFGVAQARQREAPPSSRPWKKCPTASELAGLLLRRPGAEIAARHRCPDGRAPPVARARPNPHGRHQVQDHEY